MNSYKTLNKQVFSKDDFKLVPIRYEDRFDIMKWRNEQIHHLRQAQPLTIENQEHYFETVVSKLFDDESPNQVLFSYLKNDVCIGYGGLVHINWIDKNAEISFIMDTKLEKDFFDFHWETYLELIEKNVATEYIHTFIKILNDSEIAIFAGIGGDEKEMKEVYNQAKSVISEMENSIVSANKK